MKRNVMRWFLYIAVLFCLLFSISSVNVFAADDDQYIASGRFQYIEDNGILQIITLQSTFLYECGPPLGPLVLSVQFLNNNMMITEVLSLGDDEPDIWRRIGTGTGIYGQWLDVSDDSGSDVLTINENGRYLYQGECSRIAHEQGSLGIYSTRFEFEFEEIYPDEIKTYVVGEDFEAIDFENYYTPYNLHAYGGWVQITSLSPMLEGFFTLWGFATDHGEPPVLEGSVSGRFSVPSDGLSRGTFSATGTVDGYVIAIDESDAVISIPSD